MDRYVPPTNFWGPRFYRKIMPENCLKWDQKPVSTVEKSPIFVLKPVFTMLQTKSRPAFRDFCGENPARTGGTYLSDLIGECPAPPGAGRRMHFRDVSTCGVCMCFCVCGFVKKFWRVIQNYFQLKKQVPQTLPHILPHILPHMGYPTLWPDPRKTEDRQTERQTHKARHRVMASPQCLNFNWGQTDRQTHKARHRVATQLIRRQSSK